MANRPITGTESHHQRVGRILLLGHAVTKQLDAFSCLVTPSPNSWTRSPAWSRRHQTVGRVLLLGHAVTKQLDAFSSLVHAIILLMSSTGGRICTHREFNSVYREDSFSFGARRSF